MRQDPEDPNQRADPSGEVDDLVAAHLAGSAARCAMAESRAGAEARLDALFEEISNDLAAERGLRAWLRSRSTPVRRALALGVAAVVVVATVAIWGRADLSVHPRQPLVLELALLLAFCGAAIALGVRRDLSPPPLGATLAVVGLGLLVPWLSVLLPLVNDAHPIPMAGVGEDLAPPAVACSTWGLAAGVPSLVMLGLGERLGGCAWWRDALFGLAAGLAGLVALQLHCPATQPAHLLAGHAPVVAAWVVLWVGWRRVALARRRGRSAGM